MKKVRKNQIWSSYLLTALLLLQFGFSIFHVFTSHASHSHTEIFTSDENVSVKEFGQCELCAKLKSSPSILVYTTNFEATPPFIYKTPGLLEIKSPEPRVPLNFQRGPPYTV